MVSRQIANKSVAAFSFNGTSTTVTLGALTNGAPANAVSSICLQFKLRTYTSQTIASFQGTNTKIKLQAVNRLLVVTNNANATLITSSLNLEPGKFYKVVYTFDGTTHRVFGWNITTSTGAGAADLGTINYLRLGNTSANSDAFFDGVLSKVSYYGRLLTAQEIDRFLNNSQSSFPGAVVDYSFNEGIGTTVYDSTSNGNNGTSANGAYVTSKWGDSPAPISGRMFIGGNMLYNGDLSYTTANPVKATTSLRWMNGTGGGTFSDFSFGYYFTSTTSGSALFDRTVQWAGMNSLKLATEGTAGSVVVSTINQNGDPGALITCKPGRTYIVKAMVKTQNAGVNGVYMKLNERASITANSIKSATSSTLSGDNDWTEVTIVDTTWPQIHYLALELHNTANGNDAIAWFANVRVYEDGLPYRFQKSALTTGKHFGFNSAWDLVSANPTDAAITAVFNDMLELGMDTVRASFVWGYIKSSTSAPYNFAVYDRFVSIAVSMGFTVIPILSGPGGLPSYADPAFYDYYRTVAAHYAPLGVDHFEYYNEANVTSVYSSNCSPNKYWAGFQYASPGLRAGNPNVKVLFSGVTQNTVEVANSAMAWSPNLFLQALYDLGAKGYFDIFNYHPYDWNDNVFTKIFSVLAANGDGRIPIWITEYGLATAGGGEPRAGSVNEQTEAMILAIRKVRKWPQIERCVFYNYRDEPGSPTSVEGHFGFKNTDSSNKLVWPAVKNAIINGTQ